MFYLFAMFSFSIGYTRAKAVGRNGFLWGFITAGAFVLTGWAVTLGLGFILVFGGEVWNWESGTIDNINIVGMIIAVIMSFVVSSQILRFFQNDVRLDFAMQQSQAV